MMVKHVVDDSWMDEELFVENKRKDYQKRTRRELHRVCNLDDENKAKALQRLYRLEIPKSDQILLSKLISSGQLTSVDKILFRKKKSIIISGKAKQKHRNFPTLTTDDVIIKIHINGNKNELWQRANTESHQNKFNDEGDNQPTFLLQTGRILVTSMVGTNGEPAPSLKDILISNQRPIATVYDEIIQFWCKIRHRPFHPSNLLYHDGKWWRVGYGGRHAYDTDADILVQTLQFYRRNLKRLIALFCYHGLTMKQAEVGFMKYANKYYWDTTEVMRGMTRKRSFFSIMYMGSNSELV